MAIEGSETSDAVDPAPEAQRSAAPVVQVRALAKKINLADFQNSVPALLELAVVNETAQEIRGLTLASVPNRSVAQELDSRCGGAWPDLSRHSA